MWKLLRLEHDPFQTMGVLLHDGHILCFTLEPPWERNIRFKSCVPPGTYTAHKRHSEKHGFCLELFVNGRDNVLMHKGNTRRDTTGCILPGMSVGWLEGQRAVLKSNAAMTRIYELLGSEDKCTINIANYVCL